MIKVGTYVKQNIFDDVYRYGVVIDMSMPPTIKTWHAALDETAVRVAFSPRKEHPVSVQPYLEYIAISKLEVVCD